MQDSTTEYILRSGGEIVRRDSTERNIILSEAVINQLCTSVTVHTPNVCWAVVQDAAPNSSVSLITRGREVYASFPINSLNIRAPYRLINGAMVPVFSSSADPILGLKWTAPGTMRIRVLIQFKQEVSSPRRFTMLMMWVYAYDRDGAAYRLPLPNLYEDCKVCNGDQHFHYCATIQDTIQHVMEMFQNSSWNADLWTTVDESQTLFSFLPEGDGAQQTFKSRVVEPWQSYCRKVATAYSVMVQL